MTDEWKRCPFCGEQILSIAIKCKHCGSMLDGSSGTNRNGTSTGPGSQGSGSGGASGHGGLLAPGSVVQNYQVVRVLGQGGMGVVYEAVHQYTEQRVALKAVWQNLMMEETSRRRFLEEGRTMARLKHPNIVPLLNFFEEGGTFFLVMEFLEGRTLDDSIRELAHSGTPAGVDRVAHVATQVLTALGFAHHQNPPVVHRDIKPQNIMLTPDGRAIVMDFGIAKVLGREHITRTRGVVGTYEYMSPEQVQGEPVSPASDVYSMGIVMYQMLTGNVPFPQTSDTGLECMNGHVSGTVPELSTVRSDCPSWLVEVLRRALEKDPRKRYSDAQHMKEAIAAGTRKPTESASEESRQPSPAEPDDAPRILYSSRQGVGRIERITIEKRGPSEAMVVMPYKKWVNHYKVICGKYPSSSGIVVVDGVRIEVESVERALFIIKCIAGLSFDVVLVGGTREDLRQGFEESAGPHPESEAAKTPNQSEVPRTTGRPVGAGVVALVLLLFVVGAFVAVGPDIRKAIGTALGVAEQNSCGMLWGECKNPQSLCVRGKCSCIAQCQGKTCGHDGCGGACGTCETGAFCMDGNCAFPKQRAMDPYETATSFFSDLRERRFGALAGYLPPRYLQDMDRLVHAFANSMDEDLWGRFVGLAKRARKIAVERRQSLVDFLTQSGAGLSSEDWGRLVDGTVATWDLLESMGLTELSSLREFNTANFASRDCERLAGQVWSVIAATSLKNVVGAEMSAVDGATVGFLSQNGDSALVQVTVGTEVETVALVRVEEKWVPEELATEWGAGISELLQDISEMKTEMDTGRTEILAGISAIEKGLDEIDRTGDVAAGFASFVGSL